MGPVTCTEPCCETCLQVSGQTCLCAWNGIYLPDDRETSGWTWEDRRMRLAINAVKHGCSAAFECYLGVLYYERFGAVKAFPQNYQCYIYNCGVRNSLTGSCTNSVGKRAQWPGKGLRGADPQAQTTRAKVVFLPLSDFIVFVICHRQQNSISWWPWSLAGLTEQACRCGVYSRLGTLLSRAVTCASLWVKEPFTLCIVD
ncbi:hypothetical protein CEXT_497621 [Caerostris extrusa]|uniref:Uncharacterized protein n=1 Tax=Caerostris extrusa TaxID=172846 RepID=A0AAV4XR31_CAEEX|nr:hypothetical protein CEXT_497621 [Caerostris extrusa]